MDLVPSLKWGDHMKKFIFVLSVVLVLVFSCVLTSFAEASPFVDVPNMTSPPWVPGGSYTVHTYNFNGKDLKVVAPKANSYANWYMNVTPVSATRKYTFKFNVLCSTLNGTNSQKITAKVFYKDIGSGETILLWQSSKPWWNDHGNVFVDRTVIFPDTFQSSTGRIVCYIENNTDNSNAFISVYNLHITDMTTADLDNSLDKFGNRIDNIVNPSVPYNSFDNGSFKDSANELKNAENALPTVDFGAVDELANSIDVSSYSQAFASINQLFIRVVDTIGITPLIFFACFFGFCIFLIGRKLSGG